MTENCDLPPGWRWTTIGEVCEYVNRGRAPSYTDDSGIPVINQKCVRWSGVDWRHIKFTTSEAFARIDERQCLRDGDILWNSTGTGTIGRAAVYTAKADTPKVTVDTHITILRPRDILPGLLQLWISSHAVQGRMGTLQGGSTNQVELSRKAAMECPIPLPPEEYQPALLARIEELFGEIEAGEQELAAAKADLGRYRRAVLKAAVTGELTRDWREQNPPNETGADLLARILKERRDRWEEVERAKFAAKGQTPKNDAWKSRYLEPVAPNSEDLPQLPDGWAWATIDFVKSGDQRNGISIAGTPTPPGVKALRLDALTPNGLNLDAARYIPLAEERALDYRVNQGDLLISRANGSADLVGRAVFVGEIAECVVFPDTIIRYPIGRGLVGRWIELVWNSPLSRTQIRQLAKTTAGILKISQEDISQVRLPIPPVAEAEEALRRATEMLNVNDETDIAIGARANDAARLRQSVLVAAFGGKLIAETASAPTKGKRPRVA